MAKKNFGFEKRQKELKKKQKQEEKRLRKLERASGDGAETDQEEPLEDVLEPAEERPGEN